MGQFQIKSIWPSVYSRAVAILVAALIAPVLSSLDAAAFQETRVPEEAQALPLTPLVIESHDGRKLSFKVGVARSETELQHGLKFRVSMPADEGMLFDFGTETRIGMWMKNTYISLDMIFIDANGFIVDIARSTTPQSEEPIGANVAVIAILEINGGLSDRLGIRIGDRIVHEVVDVSPVQ